MAKLGDALTALVRQVRFDKLDPLLDRGASVDGAKPFAASTTNAPVNPVGAKQANTGTTPDALRPNTATRASTTPSGPAAQPPAQVPASVQTRLSADAALITALLGEAPAVAPKQGLPVMGLDAATQPPEQVARALVRSLATSGLFYESHLQEWVEGQRPLDSLRAEPQQRFVAMLMRAGGAPSTETAEANAPASSGATASASAAAPAATTATATPLPEALAALVREQLDALDFRRVHWQGEVWAQQQAELEIAEDDARRRDGEAASSQRGWATTLRLQLPHLGEVEARILLDGDSFAVNVRADAESLPALQSGRADFAAALNDAGIRLRTVEVSEHE